MGGVMKKIIIFVLLLIGCSSTNTKIASHNVQEITNEKYSILMRTGNPELDKVLYKKAYIELSRELDINENPESIDETGKIEITFATTSGSGRTKSDVNTTATGWFSGYGYWGGSGYASGTTTNLSSGTTLDWPDITTLMVLRNKQGKQLWTADYKFKRGCEMDLGCLITTLEAAGISIERLRNKLIEEIR